MSESAPSFAWGHEHFCEPDARHLYNTEPRRITDVGFPVELDAPPEPETFCSVCLKWFTAPPPEAPETPEP